MVTTFMEPGGDATFGAEFYVVQTSVATDFVHGTHVKSLKYRPATTDQVKTPAATLSDTGSRVSFYIYLVAYPSVSSSFATLINAASTQNIVRFQLSQRGGFSLDANGPAIGSPGPNLQLNKWYRISLAYTITDSTHSRFEAFVDGVSAISGTNPTLGGGTGTDKLVIGNPGSDSTLDFRSSDHYIDSSSSLLDTGDIWVTAKRPFVNGTVNGFTTQIGSGGSGYGTGHAPQVNERPLSTTNGWSMIGAGSAVTEEYGIENKSTGDINISGRVVVDFMGWVYASSLANETASIIVAGATSNISLTSANTMFTKAAGSTVYPAGGTDIGIITTTALTTVSLYECGIMVAFIQTPYVNDLKIMLQ